MGAGQDLTMMMDVAVVVRMKRKQEMPHTALLTNILQEVVHQLDDDGWEHLGEGVPQTVVMVHQQLAVVVADGQQRLTRQVRYSYCCWSLVHWATTVMEHQDHCGGLPNHDEAGQVGLPVVQKTVATERDAGNDGGGGDGDARDGLVQLLLLLGVGTAEASSR